MMWAFLTCRCEYDWNGEVDTGSWWGRGMCAVNGGRFDNGNAICVRMFRWIRVLRGLDSKRLVVRRCCSLVCCRLSVSLVITVCV